MRIRVGDLTHKTDAQHPTVTYDQKVSDAITILSTNRQVSAIPICEKDSGIVIDAFMRSDIRVCLHCIYFLSSLHSYSYLISYISIYSFLRETKHIKISMYLSRIS